MPKNVLFSLKNRKNRQTLPPHQSSFIVNYFLYTCPHAQTFLESTKRPYVFL